MTLIVRLHAHDATEADAIAAARVQSARANNRHSDSRHAVQSDYQSHYMGARFEKALSVEYGLPWWARRVRWSGPIPDGPDVGIWECKVVSERAYRLVLRDKYPAETHYALAFQLAPWEFEVLAWGIDGEVRPHAVRRTLVTNRDAQWCVDQRWLRSWPPPPNILHATADYLASVAHWMAL